MEENIKETPYGMANFMELQEERRYYVDKTHFLPVLEKTGKYLFLIRPRRMGKTLWIAILTLYYDIFWKDRFDEVFRDTYIQKNPTQERNSYLILDFDFSQVTPDLQNLERSFEACGNTLLEEFFHKYKDYFDSDFLAEVKEKPTTTDKLYKLLQYSRRHQINLYILIDEYDNFTNTILSTDGKEKYHEVTRGAGFFRYFFNVLKGLTSGSGEKHVRLFITGVSPITMDDVTSGFNIGKNISLSKRFNTMIGLTESEVRDMLIYYKNKGVFPLEVEEAMILMKEWYNDYRFSKKASESIFNSNMVLYFIDQVIIEGEPMPEDMIDHNVRFDYEKLRYLITIGKSLNGNFNRLKKVVEEGEVQSADIAVSFPLEKLAHSRNFYSLLFYFGLLSFGKSGSGDLCLRIPNQTVQRLMFSYIRDAYDDIGCFLIDPWEFAEMIQKMAYQGAWKTVFEFLAQEIEKQTSIHDYLSGEKIVQGFLLSYLNTTDHYLCKTEPEFNKGYADFFLEPFLTKYPDLPYAYLIELKYLKRKKLPPESPGEDEEVKKMITEAKQQLIQYSQDPRIQKLTPKVKLVKLALVFRGWELIKMEEVK